MREEALKIINDYTRTYYDRRFTQRYSSHDLCDEKYESVECVRKDFVLEAIDKAVDGMYIKPKWIKIDKKHPLPKFKEVLSFNEMWIDEDFNPTGIRIGYLDDNGNFVSAKYCPDSEDYVTCCEEGDDYDTSQFQPDGTTKTWYHRNGEAIEGYLPNLPTHFMYINPPLKKPTKHQ